MREMSCRKPAPGGSYGGLDTADAPRASAKHSGHIFSDLFLLFVKNENDGISFLWSLWAVSKCTVNGADLHVQGPPVRAFDLATSRSRTLWQDTRAFFLRKKAAPAETRSGVFIPESC